MEKKLVQIENLNNSFYVYWVLTDFCNQACSYCPPFLHKGYHAKKNPELNGASSIEEIDTFLKKLIDISITKETQLLVEIAGGEPTVHPYLPTILSQLSPYGHVNIVTNGTRGLSWWTSLSSLPSKVVISLHPEYYDSKKIRINDLAKFLVDNNVVLQFNLMCQPEKWNTVMDIVNDMDEPYKALVVPKVLQDYNNLKTNFSYSNDQKEFIRNYKHKVKNSENIQLPSSAVYSDGTKKNVIVNKLVIENEHRFQGWKCAAGVEAICVKPDGSVTAGICKAKILGNMKDFNLETRYISCPYPTCSCPADVILNKHRSDRP